MVRLGFAIITMQWGHIYSQIGGGMMAEKVIPLLGSWYGTAKTPCILPLHRCQLKKSKKLNHVLTVTDYHNDRQMF
jgi:hypothetical protein